MGYYVINIVSENLVDGHFYVHDSFGAYPRSIGKDETADLWNYISNNKWLAAKQKLSFCSCTYFVKGKPVRDQGYKSKIPARSILKGYCRMFKHEFKYMQMVFTTPRDRAITVCITYRKEN